MVWLHDEKPRTSTAETRYSLDVHPVTLSLASPGLQEQAHDVRVVMPFSKRSCAVARVVPPIRIGSSLKKDLHDLVIARGSGAHQRVVRLIQKWLNAGVLEDGKHLRVEEGTPQGGSASPLLANVYLHYAFDLWVQVWRRKRAHGDVIVVRFADDIVLGFELKSDAERFRAELEERFQKFSLELHPDKTRLLEFGRYAAESRKRQGLGKPESFAFLGFTHLCGKSSKGRFLVLRQTIRKRLQAKLSEVKTELRRRMHEPIPVVGQWLKAVGSGHVRYYGVPSNRYALAHFRFTVGKLWRRTLQCRSQKGRVPWERMKRLIHRWLPPVRICHPYPSWYRLRVTT